MAITKKTAKKIKEMVELHAKGGSAREIGELIDVEHSTVLKWLRDMNLEPNGGAGERKTRKRTKPKKEDRDLAERSAAIEADLAVGFTALGAAKQNLAEARQMLKEVRAAYVKGAASAQQVKGADDLHDKAMRALAELEVITAPTTANGSSTTDPFTEEAAQRVTYKFRELVEKEEKKRREAERRAS